MHQRSLAARPRRRPAEQPGHSEREAHTEKSNPEIARTLYVVEGTVKAHVSSILIKLDARNRVQAAILAYEAGLA